jgi:hypothetical protein
MSYPQTQIESYLSLDIPELDRSVYEAVKKKGSATRLDLVEDMDIPINTIAGACARLKDSGYLFVIGVAINPKSNKNNEVLSVRPLEGAVGNEKPSRKGELKRLRLENEVLKAEVIRLQSENDRLKYDRR